MITLYHGSDIEIKEIDLAQSRINKDFGRGFYLSLDLDQAHKFAKYKADNPESKTRPQVVTKFETDEAPSQTEPSASSASTATLSNGHSSSRKTAKPATPITT